MLSLALMTPAPLAAQGGSDAVLVGTIRDGSGALTAGVTVTG